MGPPSEQSITDRDKASLKEGSERDGDTMTRRNRNKGRTGRVNLLANEPALGLLLEILKHTEEIYRGEATESLLDVEVRLVGIVNRQWNRCLIY